MKMRDVVDLVHEKNPEWSKNNIAAILRAVCTEIRKEVETADQGSMVKIPFLGRIKIKETPKEDGARRYIFLPAKVAELEADEAAVPPAKTE